jgi:DNA-binding response OmpR family regulator
MVVNSGYFLQWTGGEFVKSAQLLIVEDDMLIAMDLQMTLEDLGYKIVSVVCTGEEGIQEAETSQIDLIIMDIRLSGKLNGIETAKLIQSRFKIPVIFITATSSKEINPFEGLIESCGYLSKPFDEEQLQTAVETALRRIPAPGT